MKGFAQGVARKAVFMVAALLLPASLAAAPFAYVSIASEDIKLIDTATYFPAGSVSPGAHPWGITVHPDGRTVYTTTFSSTSGEGFVSAIDTTTLDVTATVGVGTDPRGLVVHPQRTRLYVANHGVDSLSVIDTTSNRVIASVPTGKGPAALAITPDGALLYVTNASDETVSVIDTATMTNIDTITTDGDLGDSPFGLAISADGGTLYAAGRPVVIIETTSNTVIGAVSMQARALAFHPDGHTVYATDSAADNIAVIDTASQSVQFRIEVPKQISSGELSGLAIRSDGAAVYVVRGFTPGPAPMASMTTIDTAGGFVVCSQLVAQSPGPIGGDDGSGALLRAGLAVGPVPLGVVPGPPRSCLPDSGGGSGGVDEGVTFVGCFIATAAFGSPLAREVEVLRQFRDRFLLPTPPGRAFVEAYYRWSPGLAADIADSPRLRTATRLLLWPTVHVAGGLLWVSYHPATGFLLLLLLGTGLATMVRRRRMQAASTRQEA